MGKCKDGLVLGNILNPFVLEYKTFISPNEVRQDQQKISEELVKSLEIKLENLLNDKKWNKDLYQNTADILASIKSKEQDKGKK